MKNGIIRFIFSIIGALFILWGGFILITTNYTVGILFMIVIGVIFLIFGLFYHTINHITAHGILRVVKYIIVFGLCFIIGLSGFLFLFGSIDNVTYNEDAVIVLGCAVIDGQPSLSLANRLDAAIEYVDKNEDAIIIVSGGKGFQESVSEAEAMEKYLVERGIKPERILVEDMASSTYENMVFSKELLSERFDDKYTVAVITNDYHIFRAVNIAKSVGLDVNHYNAPTEWYNLIPSYLREAAAVVYGFFQLN